MDPELLGRLVSQHASALVLYARQWCDAPEDVVQDAFLKLVAQRRSPENPAAWLFGVVRNTARQASRSDRRRRRHEADAAASGRTPAWLTAPDGSAIDAEEAAAALRSLPIDQREVIVAHLWGGLTFAQVAALAGCSSSTTHRLYGAGLTALRERLGDRCPGKPLTPR
jgi:RNA polymerase sigma factor (sigma-70 family)